MSLPLASISATNAPIRKIPAELLAEIFLQCLRSDQADWASFPSADRMPMLVCQICSAWRYVAIADTRLWSTIDISPEKAHLTNTPMWLERAKTHPLAITGKLVHPNKNKLAMIIDSCAERIEELDITCSYKAEFLKYDNVFQNIPVLRRLSLQGRIILPQAGLGPVTSISRLTHLNIRSFSIPLSCSHSLLMGCPAIVSCKLDVWVTKETYLREQELPKVTLPHLRILKLAIEGPYAAHPSTWPAFLAPLTLPSLTNLELRNDCGCDIFHPVWRLQERSRAQNLLRLHLPLVTFDDNEHELLLFLRSAPRLEYLRMHFSDPVHKGFLDSLIYYPDSVGGDSEALVPRLQVLKLWGSFRAVNRKLLLQFINSRTTVYPPLMPLLDCTIQCVDRSIDLLTQQKLRACAVRAKQRGTSLNSRTYDD